jgi:hypothetical protein
MFGWFPFFDFLFLSKNSYKVFGHTVNLVMDLQMIPTKTNKYYYISMDMFRGKQILISTDGTMYEINHTNEATHCIITKPDKTQEACYMRGIYIYNNGIITSGAIF